MTGGAEILSTKKFRAHTTNVDRVKNLNKC